MAQDGSVDWIYMHEHVPDRAVHVPLLLTPHQDRSYGGRCSHLLAISRA